MSEECSIADKDKGWLFCEAIGKEVSPDQENEIFSQIQDMRGGFDNPKDFIVNVMERAKLTTDVEKKILIAATGGKMIGFFS